MGRPRTPSESTTVVPDSEVEAIAAEVCHSSYSSTPPASSPCWSRRSSTTRMPTTYGRPKLNPPSNFLSAKSNGSPRSRSSSPTEFNQDWKQKLKDIDNDEYDGEMVREATSSTLTPLVSSSSLSAAPESSSLSAAPMSSSLSAAPESQPLPRSSPPVSPGPEHAYRDTEMTDDPDTSVELNTTVAMPSSDGDIDEDQDKQQEEQDDTDEDDEPVRRRMTKPLRVVDSDEEDAAQLKGVGKRRLVVASTSSAMSSGNDLSQMSVDRLARSSNMTTPASSAQKPIKLALSDSESEKEDEDRIEEASSPKVGRSMRKKGLNKAEKSEMAKTQQVIAASREIRIPNASKRIDPKAFLSSYTASLPTMQAEIDSYPFPPGTRSQKSNDSKTQLRNKIAEMRPLSAHAAPKFKTPSSDPIVGSSQSAPAPAITDSEPEKTSGGGLFGKPNALGMAMFGGGAESGSEEELPPLKSLLFPGVKPKVADERRLAALAEKKRALLAQQKRVESDSDSDIELEIAGSNGKSASRILARPGQNVAPTQSRRKSEVTESQVIRAGHANHFGRDAAELSSPAKGPSKYEESQWGRVEVSSSGKTSSGWGKARTRKSVGGGGSVTMNALVRHAAKSAMLDGQAKQKADEERWKKAGGRVVKREGGGVVLEDAVRDALEHADGQAEEGDEEDEDEDDDDYRGSASEEEEEEDKENLPAGGRKPHEPVSDLEGSVEGGENDEDKENSLELVGVGSPAVAGRSPGPVDGESSALNGRSPANLNALSPADGLSPGRLVARSPSYPFGRSPSHLRLHSRVSSSGSGRLPLSELGDEDQGEAENAAVARAPLGELDVEVGAEEEEEVVRRPAKRPRQNLARRLLDDDEDEDEGLPTQKIGSRLGSPSQRRLGSPSQRRLGSPSQRRLGSPSQRFGSPSLRFSSPTPRAQPSRLRSPIPPSGTQSFSQMQTQDMLGGLGDVFGFESQAAPEKKDEEEGEGGGGLTQLFANAGAGTSNAFAALRKDATEIELTQDERAKMLYKPVITDEELRRDQELFEREDELMAMPFSPTQKEKETQLWLNEQGLWTQTRPAQTQMPTQIEATTPFDEPKSTPLPATSLGTPSSLASPSESVDSSPRRRIIRRGLTSGSGTGSGEDAPPPKIVSVLDRLMNNARDLSGKDKKKKDKKKLGKSEFVEGEAAESDDEYEFGPRLRDEDEEDEEEDRHVEGLVDDQVMDEETENAVEVQAKFMEQNAEEDAQREKVAREVVTGKHRTRRRGRDNMDLDDDDDESEEERRTGSKNLLKKRKIENDGLDELEKHESTRAFVQMYNKGITSAEKDEFAHLNQVDDPLGGEPELAADEEEEEEEEEEEGEDEEDQELKEPETPLAPARTHIPSSAHAEIAFGLKKSPILKFGDESDEEPTIDLPDATLRKGPSFAGQPAVNLRAQKWAAQEGGSSRANFSRVGQGVSVTGHNSKNKLAKTKSTGSRSALSATSSASSNKLSRLGSKADGFR